MSTPPTGSASTRALAFIASLLEEHRQAESFRLPVMHELARHAGVSVGTMSKIVTTFCRMGKLTASHRRGIFILPSHDTAVLSQQPAPTTNDPKQLPCVTERLAADIGKGTHPAGSWLPTYKELSQVYRTSGRSLRTAMYALVNRGALIHDGRGFRVSAAPRIHGRGAIALIMRGHDTGEMLFTTNCTQEHLSALERECSKANVELQIIVCNFHGIPFSSSGKQMNDLRLAVDSEQLLGCIVWSLTFTPQRLNAILHELAPLEKPIAVLDENGKTDTHTGSSVKTPVGFFDMTFTKTPGIEIGRYLCSLGHRKAAFFSPFHPTIWSTNRLNGVRHAFESAAIHQGVIEQTASMPFGYGFTLKPADINAAIAQFLPPDAADELTASTFKNSSIQPFSSAISEFYEAHRIRKCLVPLFEATIRDPAVTVWIASNDIVGAECQTYLRTKERRVPQQISVISFDDSPLAALHRLTSYNFNCPSVMRAMVAYLLDKRAQWRFRKHKKPIETGGFITVRESSSIAVSKPYTQ